MDREVTFQALGRTLGLRYTFSAFYALERDHGVRAASLFEEMSARLDKVPAIFEAGLRTWAGMHGVSLDAVNVIAILDEMPIQQSSRLIGEAILLGAVERPKATPAETPGETPRTSDGTGASSSAPPPAQG